MLGGETGCGPWPWVEHLPGRVTRAWRSWASRCLAEWLCWVGRQGVDRGHGGVEHLPGRVGTDCPNAKLRLDFAKCTQVTRAWRSWAPRCLAEWLCWVGRLGVDRGHGDPSDPSLEELSIYLVEWVQIVQTQSWDLILRSVLKWPIYYWCYNAQGRYPPGSIPTTLHPANSRCSQENTAVPSNDVEL